MSGALYARAAHEPLTETAWDPARVEHGVAAIVAEAEAAVSNGGWRNHPLDDEGDLDDGMTTLYLGAAGMIWALHRLGSGLDLAALARDAVRRYDERPDWGERTPGLWLGEAGVLHVAAVAGALGDTGRGRLRELAVENERNPTWEIMWGSAGTALAAREAGFDDEWRRSAAILLDELDRAGGIWTQEIQGKTARYIGPAHGFAGNVQALRGHLSDDELRSRVGPVLRANAVTDGTVVNWPPLEGDEDLGRAQWCHGAPGIVATLGDLMPDDLLVGGAELTWRAGPLTKGPGLCHGTAGNGYALLQTYAVTGEDVWLDRARRFAMHALEQVACARETYGRGRFSLLTGDVGVALYARSCLAADPRFPMMHVWR